MKSLVFEFKKKKQDNWETWKRKFMVLIHGEILDIFIS